MYFRRHSCREFELQFNNFQMNRRLTRRCFKGNLKARRFYLIFKNC